MTKLLLSILCLALAATSVIRCDSDSSSDSDGSEGDSGVEDSAACRAIAQYLSGDVTAPADQSQLLSSFFNDFNFDVDAFAQSNLPELIASNEFTFDIQVLRENFENFRNFINSSVVQPILGDFSTAFETVALTAQSQTGDIDRSMIRDDAEELMAEFLAAIEPCELAGFGRKIRNLFQIDIFGQLVASAECNAGFVALGGFIAAANATQGLRPDILEITDDLVRVSPFVASENYIRIQVTFVILQAFNRFESVQDATDAVNAAFMAYIDTDDLCGIVPSSGTVATFNRLFNVEFLSSLIELLGLEA